MVDIAPVKLHEQIPLTSVQGTERREQGPAFHFLLYLYLKVLKIEFE